MNNRGFWGRLWRGGWRWALNERGVAGGCRADGGVTGTVVRVEGEIITFLKQSYLRVIQSEWPETFF